MILICGIGTQVSLEEFDSSPHINGEDLVKKYRKYQTRLQARWLKLRVLNYIISQHLSRLATFFPGVFPPLPPSFSCPPGPFYQQGPVRSSSWGLFLSLSHFFRSVKGKEKQEEQKRRRRKPFSGRSLHYRSPFLPPSDSSLQAKHTMTLLLGRSLSDTVPRSTTCSTFYSFRNGLLFRDCFEITTGSESVRIKMTL